MFPSTSQSAVIGQLQAHPKLSVFEYENKDSRESENHTERPNCPSFKEGTLQKSRHESTTLNFCSL